MPYDPERHHRRSIRLRGYDYTRDGAYFVTLCVWDRECLFGEVVNGEVRLSDAGRIVADTWTWLAAQYPYVALDAWVVMPNHLHGIIVMGGRDDGGGGDGGGGMDDGGGGGVGGSRTARTDDAPARADDARARADDVAGRMGDVPARADDARARAGDVAGRTGPVKRKPLGRLIGAFKTVSTKRINEIRGTPGAVLWQRDFYEHIVRDAADLRRIRAYIAANPARWDRDRNHPPSMPHT
ncbi:transposase [Rhodocaloribacter sp.]